MVPTAVLMLLDGSFAPVPVTIDAFQPPPGSGSTSGAFLVAEHAISAYMVSSISLPELSRRTASTPLWYDFTSGTVKGISPIDGGYYLPPGFTNQEMSLGDSEERFTADLRFQEDDFGHTLPAPAGETVRLTIYSVDGQNVAWSGDVLCSSQSGPDLPPSISLKALRAIVKFERGSARVLIPESSMSLGVSLLGLFMTVFYLFVVATRLEAELASGGTHTTVESIKSSATRLFLLNGPLNAGSCAVGGLIVSSSQIQTGRETVVLIYAFAAFVAVGLAVFPIVNTVSINALTKLPLTTVRILVETCLLASIALPMGIYSKLSQFTSALVGLGIIGVSLRNFSVRVDISSVVWWVDRGFRIAAIVVLAPTVLFPVFVTSSVEYRGSSFLIYPTIVFTVMTAAVVVLTGAKLAMLNTVLQLDETHTPVDPHAEDIATDGFVDVPIKAQPRNLRQIDPLPILFLVLTALLESLITESPPVVS